MDGNLLEQVGQSNRMRGILLMLLCTFFVSGGQIFYKLASTRLSTGHILSFFNWPLIAGLVLYAAGSVLLLWALRYGQLSILYPILAVSYIWVGLGAPFLFRNEAMTVHKWIGVGLVVVGVALVGLGGGRE